jgi:hypothetical protein
MEERGISFPEAVALAAKGNVIAFPTRKASSPMQTLHCAHCGSECTHHICVKVYNRRNEDAADGLYVSVEGLEIIQGTDAHTTNPSPRRDGISIIMECEKCPGISEIEIVQHKGGTYLTIAKF